jgi:hypothetical protein
MPGKDAQEERLRSMPGKDAQEQQHHFVTNKNVREQLRNLEPDKNGSKQGSQGAIGNGPRLAHVFKKHVGAVFKDPPGAGLAREISKPEGRFWPGLASKGLNILEINPLFQLEEC